MKVLFSDELHFHGRNFPSLFKFIAKENIDYTYPDIAKELLYAYGKYDSDNYTDLIKEKVDSSRESIECLNYRGHNLFKLCVSELLAYLIPAKKLYDIDLSLDDQILFEFLYDNFKLDLDLNLSVAKYWVNFWSEILGKNTGYTHCFVFSGSNIYAKSLIDICRYRNTKVIVAEHSFTGNEYYLEEKYEHIANNSDVKHVAVRQSYLSDLESATDYFNLKQLAFSKIKNTNNKNVIHPDRKSVEPVVFKESNQTLLIIGQVVNDYSMLENRLNSSSSISIYKEVIAEVLRKTNCNIIFKSHPWEMKKTNCMKNITYDEINNYIIDEFNDEKHRIIVTCDYNIEDLFEQSDFMLVLNSQAGIEAAYHGLKPIVLNDAFYGGFGFTYNVEVAGITNILNNFSGRLSFQEYKKFEKFLISYLVLHLYSQNDEEKLKVKVFSYNGKPYVSKKIKKIKKSSRRKRPKLLVYMVKILLLFLFNNAEFRKRLKNKVKKFKE